MPAQNTPKFESCWCFCQAPSRPVLWTFSVKGLLPKSRSRQCLLDIYHRRTDMEITMLIVRLTKIHNNETASSSTFQIPDVTPRTPPTIVRRIKNLAEKTLNVFYLRFLNAVEKALIFHE